MTKPTFDPFVWTEALRETFAPVHRAQQEGLKALERFTKFQYAVAGDYLQTGLAQAQAALSSRNPSEFLSKQADLGTHFGRKFSERAQELASLASETEKEFTQFGSDTTNQAAFADPQAEGAGGARARRRRERRTRAA
jgi:hypothetical protein